MSREFVVERVEERPREPSPMFPSSSGLRSLLKNLRKERE